MDRYKALCFLSMVSSSRLLLKTSVRLLAPVDHKEALHEQLVRSVCIAVCANLLKYIHMQLYAAVGIAILYCHQFYAYWISDTSTDSSPFNVIMIELNKYSQWTNDGRRCVDIIRCFLYVLQLNYEIHIPVKNNNMFFNSNIFTQHNC